MKKTKMKKGVRKQIKKQARASCSIELKPQLCICLGFYLSRPTMPRELGSEIGPPFLFDFTVSEPETLRLTLGSLRSGVAVAGKSTGEIEAEDCGGRGAG